MPSRSAWHNSDILKEILCHETLLLRPAPARSRRISSRVKRASNSISNRWISGEKKTKSGKDYWSVNPKGQVPVLELDDGKRLTEGPVIVQYLADQKPGSDLVPAPGTHRSLPRSGMAELRHLGIAQDLRSDVSSDHARGVQDDRRRENLGQRFDWVDKQLAGKTVSAWVTNLRVADAYLFTILRWAPRRRHRSRQMAEHARPMSIASPRAEGAGSAEGGRAKAKCSGRG